MMKPKKKLWGTGLEGAEVETFWNIWTFFADFHNNGLLCHNWGTIQCHFHGFNFLDP
jgi:hypothetical protein